MNQSKRKEYRDDTMIYDANNKDLDYNILYQLWYHKDHLNILEQTDLNTIHCPLQKEVIKVNKIQHEQAIATLESLAELL